MAKKKTEGVQVQFIKVPTPWRLAYAVGETVELEEKQAKDIIAAGYGVEVEDEPAAADTNLPDPKSKPPKEKPQ